MGDCCNSDLVQNSYSDMSEAVYKFVQDCQQYISSSLDTSDWTEVVTTTLLTAHIIFLILFFCSRSLIAPFKE